MSIGETSLVGFSTESAGIQQAHAQDRNERQQCAQARRELARWQVRLGSLDLDQWQFQPRDEGRSYLRLPSASGCETWLIRWPPGSEAPLHDHGDASAVALVLRGELRERAICGADWFERSWQPQVSVELPKHIRHRVWNEREQDAYSVHVYAPSLARMTFYEHTSNGMLRAIRTEESQQW
jgi:predicted metal-dependent enzyme (double-stranded beta helix superfamily)